MSTGLITSLIGASVPRVEDVRILTGRGRYVDDLRLPGMLHAAFLRSPFPHARITSVDAARAREATGVIAVFTGEEMMALTNPLRLDDGPGMKTPAFYPLATGKVRFVGDPVALVVAESRYLAEDALELIDVDYEPLPPVATMERALEPGAPVVFEELGDNVVEQDSIEHGDLAGAFAEADRVVRGTFRQQRWATVPMETRGGVASYDPASGDLTYYASTQSPHGLRFLLSHAVRQPAHRLRVLMSDVGGAFGLKGHHHRENVAIAAATMQLGRPVKWIEDRAEHMLASGHAREETLEVEAAVKDDGTILGLKVHMTMDHGAYPAPPFHCSIFGTIARICMPGPYRMRALGWEQRVVATNKCQYVAYRGPWAVETWVREVLIDRIARELGLDPLEVRRRNAITNEEQPTPMVTGPTLIGITTREALDRAAELIGYERFRDEQRRAREQGRYLGLGISTFIEAAPGPPDFAGALGWGPPSERAEVRIEPDGHVTVFTAQAPHGQSHETTLAQVAAAELAVPFEDVRVVHGDTRVTPFSFMGTGGSRSATMAGGAVLYATRDVKEKVLRIASSMLEASVDDLELAEGAVSVKGSPDKSVTLAQVAMTAYLMPHMLPAGMEAELTAVHDFDGGEGGWSQATHVCVVEVDAETGEVRILRYLVVEDCGSLINPAVVEGQIRGGTVQGIGGALLEHAVYDEDGQFLTTTFMDYLLPTSTEVPEIEIDHIESPPMGPVNFRGVGEGGTVAAPAAVTNAVADALSPFGVEITSLPITPTRVLELIGALDGR